MRGRAALAAYLIALIAVGLLPAVAGVSQQAVANALAFSPEHLAQGDLWRLPASGLVVAGPTWTQLGELIAAVALLVALAGCTTFWRAAVAGHVGSTLLAYALVGTLAATKPRAVDGLLAAPDYGISCVFAGSLGALAAVVARRAPSRGAGALGAAACSMPLLSLCGGGFTTAAGALDLASVEHLLAYACGGLAGVPLIRPDVRPARSARSRARWRSAATRGATRRAAPGPPVGVAGPAGRC